LSGGSQVVLVIAVVGSKGSGKTTTIEYLIRQLVKEGFKVGAIKHIHDPNFTIDTPNKDTFRFAQAGAKIIATSSAGEIAILKKADEHSESFHLPEILDFVEKEKLDIVFLEGFHSIIAKRNDVYKIVTAKGLEDLEKTLCGTGPPILAVTGLIANQISETQNFDMPNINVFSVDKGLLKLVKGILMRK
jgi:molybdopterin-guanine dinucleotide biosynthesis protein MobB